MEHIVWIDVETGGTDPAVHQITQVAAIATTGDASLEEIEPAFERKLELIEGHYTQEALDVQAYSPAVWDAEAIPATQAMRELEFWLKRWGHDRLSKKGKRYRAAHMGGHNAASFDAEFLRATADRCGVWLPLTCWTGGVFDTLHMAKAVGLLRGQDHASHTLEDLCREYGLPAFAAHDALEDVRATIGLARALLARMTGGA